MVIQVALAQLCLVLPMITSLEGSGGLEVGYKQSYDPKGPRTQIIGF